MRCKKNIALLMMALACCLCVQAQDTATMIGNFNKVMGFAVQPYLYYNSTTKMSATPILQTEDTMGFKGEYYKNETNLYSSNAKEVIYLEDSFYIEINHDRKSIWISKVNEESKKKMNMLPLDRKDIQALFRKTYTISQTIVNKESTKLHFETVQSEDSISKITMQIVLQYNNKDYLPKQLVMSVQMKQQISDENVQQLKEQGTDTKELLQTKDSVNIMTRTQKMTMTFDTIDNSKEKAMQMPSWKSMLAYDAVKNEFAVKNKKYEGYEITKTY